MNYCLSSRATCQRLLPIDKAVAICDLKNFACFSNNLHMCYKLPDVVKWVCDRQFPEAASAGGYVCRSDGVVTWLISSELVIGRRPGPGWVGWDRACSDKCKHRMAECLLCSRTPCPRSRGGKQGVVRVELHGSVLSLHLPPLLCEGSGYVLLCRKM